MSRVVGRSRSGPRVQDTPRSRMGQMPIAFIRTCCPGRCEPADPVRSLPPLGQADRPMPSSTRAQIRRKRSFGGKCRRHTLVQAINEICFRHLATIVKLFSLYWDSTLARSRQLLDPFVPRQTPAPFQIATPSPLSVPVYCRAACSRWPNDFNTRRHNTIQALC